MNFEKRIAHKGMVKILLSILFVSLGLSASNLDTKVEIESKSHKNKIGILEDAEKCIQKVETKRDYKKCEKAEKQGRKGHQKEMFSLRKEEKLKMIDERISSMDPDSPRVAKMTKVRNCLQRASSREEAKMCKPKHR